MVAAQQVVADHARDRDDQAGRRREEGRERAGGQHGAQPAPAAAADRRPGSSSTTASVWPVSSSCGAYSRPSAPKPGKT